MKTRELMEGGKRKIVSVYSWNIFSEIKLYCFIKSEELKEMRWCPEEVKPKIRFREKRKMAVDMQFVVNN